MKRLTSMLAESHQGHSVEISLCVGLNFTATIGSSSSLCEQKCGIRNLHQYPKARYKSLVKDVQRFSRNWWLTAGNNYESVSEKGHEREATENFAVYRDDSANDRFVFSTNNLRDIPPAERLDAIVKIMEERWKVRDGNRGFDKACMLLEALECFSELRLLGQLKPFDALPEPDQDTFLQYVEGCAQYAQACSHSHPDAVAVLVRAAQICDEMRCVDKRDEMLHVAEVAARRMDRAYAFARPRDKMAQVKPPTVEEVSKLRGIENYKFLQEKFKDTPAALETKPRLGCIYGARNRRSDFNAMKGNDPRLQLLAAPYRPETDSWTS